MFTVSIVTNNRRMTAAQRIALEDALERALRQLYGEDDDDYSEVDDLAEALRVAAMGWED